MLLQKHIFCNVCRLKRSACFRRNSDKYNVKILVILLVLFAFIFGGGTVVANAEAVAETTSVQEVIDNSIFVTFRKGDNESRGKYMVACYFVPMEYYDSSYTYGAVIFPKDYGIKHGLVSDYLRVAEENGVVVINIVAIKGITEPNGYGFNFGITNIYESNLSRTFTFIFYAKDADGNIAYAVPQFADYSSLQAGEMTTEELIQKAEQANDVQSSFRSIVLKLQELIDSVWIYVVIAFSSVVAVWGAYIGIRVTVAKKNEEKVNARGMVKQLAVGIIVMFVLAMGTPLVINGLSHWVTW